MLRLQLDEFAESVTLKDGVILPEQWQATNQTTSDSNEVVYDYQPYAEATSDPELWDVQAQSRRVWTTETTLLDQPNLTHPIVVPFTVAVPAVNYPTGSENTRMVRNGQHSFSDLSYEYTAIVTFTDGRIVDVPAGHTTFFPVFNGSPTKTPSSWNTTFKNPCEEHQDRKLDRCLPKDQRSEFVAEVTLEEGNIIQLGRLLKGRVTVHSTHGSTTVSEISVGVWRAYRDHSEGGVRRGASFAQQRCSTALGAFPLNAESSSYEHIFAEAGTSHWSFPPVMLVSSGGTEKSTFTPAHPHLDFEFQVPQEKPVNFASYYTSAENQLLLELEVLYSPEVADCLKKPPPRPPRTAEDEAAAVEERLWDAHTRVGHPVDFTSFKPPPKN
ncbi:hypothetical protein B0H19DRAFT_1364943 [Mycena capillaripes]|nr:hypothetical protein B0H19DRAFT_1364943 [Mycena capillaripes]